jgi:hypothetical protein
MPTLTKLAALVLFCATALHLGLRYQLLNDDVPVAQSANMFLAAVAGAVGWVFVGPRIDRSFLRGVTIVLQGHIATLLVALVLSGLYDIFTNGYSMRYKGFGDALNGSVAFAASIMHQSMDAEFLKLVAGGVIVMSVLLVMIYRTAEAKRLAR